MRYNLQYCTTIITTYFQKMLFTPKGNPIASKPSILFLPSPAPGYYLPSPASWVSLCWICPINGVIHYVSFCVWRLSGSIMFSRISHIVLCVSGCPSFSWLSNILVQDWNHTVFIHPSMGGHPFDSCVQCCCGHMVNKFCYDVCLHFSWVYAQQ